MEIPRPSFRPLRTLSYPHLFSPITLGTDSVEWRAALLLPQAAPQDHSMPPAPSCRLLPRGSFSLATTCSLGRRVWIASPWGSTGE